MVEFLQFGKFLTTQFLAMTSDDFGERIVSMGHEQFTTLLRKYHRYLIDKQVCPKCNAYPLAAPDHQNECTHCHNCSWREE